MKKKLLSAILLLSVATLCLFCITACKTNNGQNSGSDSSQGGEHIHKYIETVIEPTCTTGGYTLHKCSCGEEYRDNETLSKGHKYGNWVETIASSCQQEGSERRVCSDCDYTEFRSLSKKSHEYVMTDISIISAVEETTYQCAFCGHQIIENTDVSNIILDCETNFYFDIIFEGTKEEIYTSLLVFDAYFDNAEDASFDSAKVSYNTTLVEKNIWRITPTINYEQGITYVARITNDNIKFKDYLGNSILFAIKSEIHEKIEFNNDIVFLKALENQAPGYYPYALYYQEESESLCLSVGRVDGLVIGSILCIGEVESMQGLFATTTADVYFGKIETISANLEGNYVVTMSCPDILELFDTLDVYAEQNIDFSNSQLEGNIEEQVEAALFSNNDFLGYISSVNLTAESYLSERNFDTAVLTTAAFMDCINLDPSVRVDGTKIYVTINGDITVPIKTKAGVKIGSIKVYFKASTEIQFELSLNHKIKFTWFIPTGIEYFDFRLTQKDTFTFEFGVDLDIDYKIENGQTDYIYNEKSKMVHSAECRHVKNLIGRSDNLKYITAAQLVEYLNKTETQVCDVCKAGTLNRTILAKNEVKKKVHCSNCYMVTESMLYTDEPIEDLLSAGYTACDICNPDSTDKEDFESRLLQTIEYADWSDKIQEITKWAKNSNISEYSATGVKLCGVSFNVAYVFTVNLDVSMVLQFKLEASLAYKYEISHSNTYGMRLKNGHAETYSIKTQKASTNELHVAGKAEFKYGIKADLYISILGLSKYVRVGISAEAGVYAEIAGVANISFTDDDDYAAAYLDAGLYFDIDAYYKFFKWQGSAEIYSDKLALLAYGYDRAYYGYADYTESIDISDECEISSFVSLNVNYYDLQTMSTSQDVLSLLGVEGKYTIEMRLNDGTYLKIVDGKLCLKDNHPCKFSDVLYINVISDNTWKKYTKGNAVYYLEDYEVTINYYNEDHCNFVVTSHTDPTCVLQGNTKYHCSVCDKEKIDIIDATGLHSAQISYVWSSDNSTCTATMVCTNGGGHKETETVTATITVTQQRTCELDEISTYNAAFTNSVFEKQTKENVKTAEKLGHTKATAVEENKVEPTCEKDGSYDLVIYCSTCHKKLSTEHKTITARGHNYGEVSYVWNSNNTTCTATRVCANNSNHKETETVNATITVTQEQSCVLPELSTYSATFSHTAFMPQTKSGIQTADKKGHNYVNDVCLECGKIKVSEGLAYSINQDGETCTITGIGTCTDEEIIIPSVMDGYTVTAIGDNAFDVQGITSITIPDSVTSIGSYAFRGCRFTNITIPDSVTTIGKWVFLECMDLTSLYIPASVTKIGEALTAYCDQITTITVADDNRRYKSVNNCLIDTETKVLVAGCQNSVIPTDGSVTAIGNSAFFGCRTLLKLSIPDSVTSIGAYAFAFCQEIYDLRIPDTLMQIGEMAFSQCYKLVYINIPACLNSIGDQAFDGCQGLLSVSLPSCMTTITHDMFTCCLSLESIVIPKSITSIAEYVFEDCEKLKDVYYVGTSSDWDKITIGSKNENLTEASIYFYSETQPTENGKYWHYDENGNIVIWQIHVHNYINDVCLECGKIKASEGLAYSINQDGITCTITGIGTCTDHEIIVPSVIDGYTVTAIGDNAFYGSAITSAVIPGGVVSLGTSAFHNCYNLVNVVLSDSITSIGEMAFCRCTSITSFTIPKMVTIIEQQTFASCESLLKIIIPDHVTSIDYRAFDSCYNLTSVTITGGVTSIGSSAFEACYALQSITISKSVISIGPAAFSSCEKIKDVYYIGTSDDWNKINLTSNDNLMNAEKHYYGELDYIAWGDSITYGIDGTNAGKRMENPYPTLIGENLMLKSYRNKGVSGATFCKNNLGRTNMTENILSCTESADIVSVMLGVNDFAANLPLGSKEDKTNDTVYGSLYLICEHFKTYYSDSFVFFMTPFPYSKGNTPNQQGYLLKDVAEAIKYMADKYNYPVLDMFTESEYETEMTTKGDGLHPSQEYFVIYGAPKMQTFIVTNYPNKIKEA